MKFKDIIKNKKIKSIEFETYIKDKVYYKKFKSLKELNEVLKQLQIIDNEFSKDENDYYTGATTKDKVDVVFKITLNEQKLN